MSVAAVLGSGGLVARALAGMQSCRCDLLDVHQSKPRQSAQLYDWQPPLVDPLPDGRLCDG